MTLYEKSSHAIGIKFINDYVEDAQKRLESFDGIRSNKKYNLIFFDPDNGIEVKSTRPKTVHKYVLWNDIKIAFNSGKSVLVYQHFPRRSRDTFIKDKLKEFENYFNADVLVIKVKHSVYFLLTQKSHLNKIRKSLNSYLERWK